MGFFSSITAFDVLIEAIGILGIIASIISFQCKKHSRLLLFRSANESLFALQYGLLGAYTGMAMNVIGVVRNVVFTELVKRKKSTVPARIAFGAVFVVFVAVTWAGFKSLLSGTAKVISTFAYGSTNFALTRVLIFITSTSWFVYNLLVKSYAGCACELLTIGSIIVSLIRYKSDKKKLAVATADAAATDTTTDGTANNYTATADTADTATADTADTATADTTHDDTATDETIVAQTAAATTDGQNIIENVTDERKEN